MKTGVNSQGDKANLAKLFLSLRFLLAGRDFHFHCLILQVGPDVETWSQHRAGIDSNTERFYFPRILLILYINMELLFSQIGLTWFYHLLI